MRIYKECYECGRLFPLDDLIREGDIYFCAACKQELLNDQW